MTVKKQPEKLEKIYRKFSGIVVSDKMDKTIVVKVETTKIHKLYQKRFKVSSKFKVHDPKNTYKEGDKVEFRECRPLSKEKRWIVIEK
jgi:small subunit ribosomal protein S17